MAIRGVQCSLRNIGLRPQRFQAEDRMPLDHLELLRGELSGLVENLRINAHLADVMQQPRHAQQLEFVVLQAEMIAEAHRHDRHRQAVQAGVEILVLQPDQPEHGAFIAQHAGQVALDGAMACAGVDHSSMLHVGQYLFDQAGAIQIGCAGLFHLGRKRVMRSLYRLANTRPDDRNRRIVLQANSARIVDIDILATVA